MTWIILFSCVWVEFVNMMEFYFYGYVTLYGKKDFADVIKLPNQLSLI